MQRNSLILEVHVLNNFKLPFFQYIDTSSQYWVKRSIKCLIWIIQKKFSPGICLQISFVPGIIAADYSALLSSAFDTDWVIFKASAIYQWYWFHTSDMVHVIFKASAIFQWVRTLDVWFSRQMCTQVFCHYTLGIGYSYLQGSYLISRIFTPYFGHWLCYFLGRYQMSMILTLWLDIGCVFF